MFDQTFVKPDSPAAKAGPMTASVVLQCAFVLTAIVLSIARTQTLPMLELKTRLIAPPPPAVLQPIREAANRNATPQAQVLVRPRPYSVFDARPVAKAAAPSNRTFTEAAPVVSAAGGAYDGFSGLMSVFGSASERPAPPRLQPPPAAKPTPQRVSEGVAAANLIEKVIPQYPRLAVIAHIQGSVRFRAIIGTDGRIQNLQLISGPPLLVAAAREAVLAWRYRPTLLNGVAVPVLTDIAVNFTLAGN